jgi:cobalt-precorrin-5B (C1)-methyltransferase
MILVFGGTTEGRKAVEVLEESGSLYYYSTRSDGQQIELVNGVHLTGGMDGSQMIAFCREHDIKLIVDAAHPFAEELHKIVAAVATELNIPVIRYDRIYPPHDEDLVWCKDYDDAICQLEKQGIKRLLALTGVNTIGRLRSYWEQHECWFRILNRRDSQKLAHQSQFPEDHLVYYETDDTSTLIRDLHPDAIITKESGLSGGFTEKVEAARQAGIKVYVIERPIWPPKLGRDRGVSSDPQPPNLGGLYRVNGPHGLRRAVEQQLPEFFPLHSGLTTGTCATAAAVAATKKLLYGEMPQEVPVILPDGETIHVPVGYGKGYAYCIKKAGDDPDVTDGIEIRACIELSDEFEICGGEGVGRFTLPGFDFPPGEAAINKGPRRMIEANLSPLITHHSPLRVTISVPGGEEIARKTFNPRLGIEGGISIIGVSGIVKPFSEEAFIDSIRKCMEVAKAAFFAEQSGKAERFHHAPHVVINSGAKSERFVRARYPDLPAQAFVEYGNYIGETLKIAHELEIPNITLGVMLGKAVKLAAGHLDTHSKKSVMDKVFIAQMLDEAHLSPLISLLPSITLARELWDILDEPTQQKEAFARVVIGHCEEHCRPLVPKAFLTILLIDDEGHVYEG